MPIPKAFYDGYRLGIPVYDGDVGLLACPRCLEGTVHLVDIRVAARGEDKPFRPVGVSPFSGDLIPTACVPVGFGGEGRRDRTALLFYCEQCDLQEGKEYRMEPGFALVFLQHKGATYMSTVIL